MPSVRTPIRPWTHFHHTHSTTLTFTTHKRCLHTVDAYEFSALKYQQLKAVELVGGAVANLQSPQAVVEFKPHFHEWATVQPGETPRTPRSTIDSRPLPSVCLTPSTKSRTGMVCLARKKKTAVFRQYVAAETAVPVIACATQSRSTL